MKQRKFQTIETNGIRLRVVVEGKGPLVILLHGWPQGWYLWRHQIDPIIEAGFTVAVPDQRGYGGSDAPADQDSYNLVELASDIVGIADALGYQQFLVVGHDWGAPVAWNLALLHEDRVKAVACLSVPYFRFPIKGYTQQEFFGDKFWYMVYFQKPGVAEAEFEANPRRSIHMIHWMLSGDAPEDIFFRPMTKDSKFLDHMPELKALPSAMTQEDLDYFTAEYERAGFRGGLNWYRNIDRSMEMTKHLEGRKVQQPSFFITGEKDVILKFPGVDPERVFDTLADLRGTVVVPGAGHWVQAERPDAVNPPLIEFLKSVR